MDNIKNKLSNLTSSKYFMVVVSFIGLYLLSTGTSWAIFSYLREEPTLKLDGDMRAGIDPNLPKTEECPLNGALFSKPERDIWEKRRPVAAIIENHAESRPPTGISRADVVYEAVAEGGITRFLAIYYCGAAASDVQIAPVRSARVYFIDWAAEYGDKPIFTHVGGANDYAGTGETARAARALELLETLGWRVSKGNDLDTTFDSGFPIFWRNYERLDHPVATEHTMMASLDAAYEEAERRGFGAENAEGDKWDDGFVKWKFTDGPPEDADEASELSFEFWSNSEEYDVIWKYNQEKEVYLRENDGAVHIDKASGEQISAKNVVILFARERGPVDINKHILYTTIGTGKALVFRDGKVIEGTWRKDSETERTEFVDKGGSEIAFAGGPIWIEVVPSGNEIEY